MGDLSHKLFDHFMSLDCSFIELIQEALHTVSQDPMVRFYALDFLERTYDTHICLKPLDQTIFDGHHPSNNGKSSFQGNWLVHYTHSNTYYRFFLDYAIWESCSLQESFFEEYFLFDCINSPYKYFSIRGKCPEFYTPAEIFIPRASSSQKYHPRFWNLPQNSIKDSLHAYFLKRFRHGEGSPLSLEGQELIIYDSGGFLSLHGKDNFLSLFYNKVRNSLVKYSDAPPN